MVDTYSQALAPGTYQNRFKQAKYYVTFCVLYNVNVLFPSMVQACMYAQYLANAFKAVSSVKNYLSGARSYIVEHGGNAQPFATIQVDHMIKSITKRSTHVVRRAFPLKPQHLMAISNYLDVSPLTPRSIKAAILIGFSCYLRSSNLLAPSFSILEGSHTLLAKNIVVVGNDLKVKVCTTKSTNNSYVLVIPSNTNLLLCPVTAWITYVRSTSLDPNGPAFMLDRVSPLTSGVVVKIMRDALSRFPDVPVQDITMHSLRRGAAQSAQDAGAPISDIMRRGAWKSKSGLKPYLTS